MLVIILAHGVLGLLQGLLGLFMDSLHPVTVYFGGRVFDILICWLDGSWVITIVGVKRCQFGGCIIKLLSANSARGRICYQSSWS